MLVDQPNVFDMRQDVQDFVHQVYSDTLPPYTSDADIRVLWVAADRMTMFRTMADNSEVDNEHNFLMAVHNDYKMLFYGMLYAISTKSDEIARLRHQLVEKNAQDNQRNIDSFANTG